ncbi:LisH domain-containing protein [Plasmodiophora brassicae]
MPFMTVTSDEVNYLVYRYMLESGFVHSAFSFGHESHIAKSKIGGGDVPAGALVSYLQKGLQHTEIECHINEDGTETLCDAAFSLLTRHQCSVRSKVKLFDPDVPIDEDFGVLETSRDAICHYRGHTDVVFTCAFNPEGTLLVSGCQDGTARLWLNVDDPSASSTSSLALLDRTPSANAILLSAWSPDGSMFALAAVSGEGWIWTAKGSLVSALSGHTGPVSGLRWAPSSALLLTCSLDESINVWTASTGKLHSTYKTHAGAVLDCDWNPSGASFLSCSVDTTIALHETRNGSGGHPTARLFKGHTRDVNCVRWSPDATLFASCSDDTTVKIWDPNADDPVHDLHGHGRDVCTLAWATTTTTTHDGTRALILASASFDCTVRIWSAARGTCLLVLSKHLHPVTSVSFTSGGEHLAASSHDRVFVWSVGDGALVRTYKATGGVNCLSWHASGERLAVACANNSLITLRVRS